MLELANNGLEAQRTTVLAAVIDGAPLTTMRPHTALERFTGCFFKLVYKSGAYVETLPDPSTYLLVEIRGEKQPRCVIAGPRLKSARSARTDAQQVVGIRLRPGVAYLLTGVSPERWVGRRESLLDVLGDTARTLARRIAVCSSTEAQFDLLQEFLLERLAGKAVDARVSTALHLIQTSRGGMRIRDIADTCGVSCRQLERLLRLWVGILPKLLARVARFQAALVCAGKQPNNEWAYVAAEQNYVDQAHLIHEFSGFTGSSAARFSSLASTHDVKASCD